MIGHMPSKIWASPVMGQKGLKNVGFKGCQIIRLSGVPTFVKLALFSMSHTFPASLLE
jgi:hypothetical protein